MAGPSTSPDLPEWLDKALDVGIYPVNAGPDGTPRTPKQDGWNEGVIAVTEAVEKAWAALSGESGEPKEAVIPQEAWDAAAPPWPPEED